MKKHSLVLAGMALLTLILSGCGETVKVKDEVKLPAENIEVNTDKSTKEEIIADTSGLAPFFQTKEIEYREALTLNTDEVLSNYQAAILAKIDDIQKSYGGNSTPTKWDDIKNNFKIFEVGTIKKAPYEHWKLINMLYTCDGPCMAEPIFRFVYDSTNKKLVFLPKYSNASEWGMPALEVFSKEADEQFILPGFKLPKSLTLPNGIDAVGLDEMDVDFALPKDKWNIAAASPYSYMDFGKVAFNDQKLGNIYFGAGNGGCLFVKLPDGSVAKYSFKPEFFDDNNFQTIKWNDKKGYSNLTGNYSLMARGCGIGASCYFIENVKESDLAKAGTTTSGMDLYLVINPLKIADAELSDPNNNKYNEAQKTFAQAFNTYENSWQYMDENTRGEKMNFEQFVEARPVLYWKDPFGRLVAIILNTVKEPAECGKPVIYLYPEKTTDVSVKVGIQEFTKTVPEYGQGWTVKAEPNGKLLNYADGQNYPYLFWEGKTDKYIAANSGFVVARADLKNFLTDSLGKLGLNKNEQKDFLDFWLAKMESSTQPYFLISFLGTAEFNKIAPLEISPKPETLIRVFMYYQPVSSKFEIKEQVLSALPRKGFTVIEWGGTSSESWQVK